MGDAFGINKEELRIVIEESLEVLESWRGVRGKRDDALGTYLKFIADALAASYMLSRCIAAIAGIQANLNPDDVEDRKKMDALYGQLMKETARLAAVTLQMKRQEWASN